MTHLHSMRDLLPPLALLLAACPFDPSNIDDEAGTETGTETAAATESSYGPAESGGAMPGPGDDVDDQLDPRLEPLVAAWCHAGVTCDCGQDYAECLTSTRLQQRARQVQALGRGQILDIACVDALVAQYSSESCAVASGIPLSAPCSPWVGSAGAGEPCNPFPSAPASLTCGTHSYCGPASILDFEGTFICHPTGLGPGEPCPLGLPVCAEGMLCMEQGDDATGACQPFTEQPGSSCSFAYDCPLDQWCDDDVCVVRSGPWETCEGFFQCTLDSQCWQGSCMPNRCITP